MLHELATAKEDRLKLAQSVKQNNYTLSSTDLAEPRFEDVVPQGFRAGVADVMLDLGGLVFGLHDSAIKSNQRLQIIKGAPAYEQWVSLMRALHNVALVGPVEEGAWARSVVSLLRQWVVKHFGDVQGIEPAASRLKHGIMWDFCPTLRRLCVITMEDGTVIDLTRGEGVELEHRLSEMALDCLGEMRSRWLCDTVLSGDQVSGLTEGTIADLKVSLWLHIFMP